jgi:hypothetical protein
MTKIFLVCALAFTGCAHSAAIKTAEKACLKADLASLKDKVSKGLTVATAERAVLDLTEGEAVCAIEALSAQNIIMINSVFAPVGSVTATGVITSLGVEDLQLPVGVIVGGTFVGTVVVEVAYDSQAASPTWVQFSTSLTAPGTVKVDIPVKAVRVRCSAFTSGTIVAGIGALLGTV